jgi:hypothetical protein
MVIETVRYLGIEMPVLLKIQIGNEGVPEIATGLYETGIKPSFLGVGDR